MKQPWHLSLLAFINNVWISSLLELKSLMEYVWVSVCVWGGGETERERQKQWVCCVCIFLWWHSFSFFGKTTFFGEIMPRFSTFIYMCSKWNWSPAHSCHSSEHMAPDWSISLFHKLAIVLGLGMMDLELQLM